MIRKVHTIKINLPGGVVDVSDLHTILKAAEKARIEEIRFGTRQQLYVQVLDSFLEAFVIEMHLNNFQFEENEELYPNIMSSFVTQAIFQNTEWLTGKIYKEILGSFAFTPTLKVNIVDSEQSLIPFFTGNINFISSEQPDYWYLYIRFPKTDNIYCWKDLVTSANIAPMSKMLEDCILQNKRCFITSQP